MSAPRLRWRRVKRERWDAAPDGWELMFGDRWVGHVFAGRPPREPFGSVDRWRWVARVATREARGEAPLTDEGAAQCKRECRAWVEARLSEEGLRR